jgi:chemotaxis protein methyltransferase CheR
MRRLSEDRAEAEAFSRSLNITYSEFFRNPLAFALLEQLILPRLLGEVGKSGRSEVRVWSAGCAAGQEAWSVAILLEELAAARERPVTIRIFATDVSETALALARKGVYDPAAVQNIRLKHLRDYFSAQGEAYVVTPRLRARVDFSAYDLLDARSACPPASLYGDFDLILCSNLLFYYRPDLRQHILDKVCRALSPGGYFVSGEAERDIVAKHDGFGHVAPPAAVFQKIGAS